MDKTFISAYAPKLKVSLSFPADEGRTKQSFKDECDINNIMARFQKTGVIAFANKFQARYGDVTGVDFANAMRVVADARTMFAELPARVRERFANDPARFLEFVQNPANKDEARALGLLKPEAPAPVPEEAPPQPLDVSAEGGKGAVAPK